jgi:hypothetical protein
VGYRRGRGAPEGAELRYERLGNAEANPARTATCAGREAARPDHPIAPTEFPKGRSAGGYSGAMPPYHTASAPQEEVYRRQSRPRAATGGDVPPKALVWPASQRPAAHKPTKGAREPGGRRGFGPPKGVPPPGANERTRVDIASRRRGAEGDSKAPGSGISPFPIYPAATTGNGGRDIQYKYRKLFPEGLFCMCNRGDMRNAIQRAEPVERHRGDLVKSNLWLPGNFR